MTTIREKIEKTINELYGENAIYVLRDRSVKDDIATAERFAAKGREDMVEFCSNTALKRAEEFNENRLSPATVKVGDGATVCLFSDRNAGTIVKVTKASITIQYDKATLDPNFKPEVIPGGFAGHCVNQEDQTYTYERNPEGRKEVFRWSNKYNHYQGKDGSIIVIKGRHEFYDYNF